MKARLDEVMEKRRSIRTLERDSRITRETVEKAIGLARHAPSAYNAQTSRLVVLMNEEHGTFWDIAEKELRLVTPPDAFARTQKKLDGFRGGNGTVLFYEDAAETEKLKQDFPLYADKFDAWAQHNNAILEYAVWLAFAEREIASSLQHYNPLVDADAAKEWDIPESWVLVAQMPFGRAAEEPGLRTFKPLDEIVKFYG